MFCKNCGKEIPENARFCSGCGTPVSIPAPPAPEPVIPEVITPEAVPENVSETVAEVVDEVIHETEAPSEPNSEPTPPPQETPAPEEPLDDLAAALEPVAPAQPAVAVTPLPEVQPAVPNAGQSGKPPILGQKKGRGKFLLIGAAVIAVLALVLVLVNVLPSMGGGKDVFVYLTDDDELMYRKDLKAKTEPVELTDEETSGVRFSEDGKYIYFSESSGDGTSTLYRIETAKIGKNGVSPEKVSASVSDFTILKNGGAVYTRGSGSDRQLRLYDGKDSYKLASGISAYSIGEKETYAYYTEVDSDGTKIVCRVELKENGEKEKLVKDADTVYYMTDDIITYGKSSGTTGEWDTPLYDIYSQVPGGDKTKLASDVEDVLSTHIDGSKVSLLYLTSQTETRTLYDFVTDSMASSDAQKQEPDTSDYQKPGYWGWTTDWDAYEAAYQEWEPVATRNYMRDYMQNIPFDVTTYNLSLYQDGNNTTIAEDLAFYPAGYDLENSVYIYAKSDQEVTTVADLSDLEYAEEVYNLMGSANRTWYQNINGKESELDVEESSGVGMYVLNGNEVILALNVDGESQLNAYSLGKDSLSFTSTVTDDDYTVVTSGTYKGKDVLYFFTDMDSDYSAGELMRYVNGEKTSVAKDAARVTILPDSGAAFKTEDETYNDRRGTTEYTLSAVKDGKATRIADDVSSYVCLSEKQVLYISDGDLYVWNGNDSEKLASDVSRFWAKNSTAKETYFCNY